MTDLVPEPVTELDALTDDTSPSTARSSGPEMLHAIDEQLLDRLVGQARDGGLQLTGEGGLLAQLTKRLVESALEGEITDLWVPRTGSPHATCRYSWTRPPSRSRRSTRMPAPESGGTSPAGGRWCSDRCGRWLLKCCTYSRSTTSRWCGPAIGM